MQAILEGLESKVKDSHMQSDLVGQDCVLPMRYQDGIAP